MRLIQNLLNRQEFDAAFGSFVERGAFVFGVFSIPERDEEAALPAELRNLKGLARIFGDFGITP